MLLELGVLSFGFLCGFVWHKKFKTSIVVYPEIPFAIAVLEGAGPFALREPETVANPVLTAAAVTDIRASFVADPFLVRDGDRLLMFFEVMNVDRKKGELAVAESRDGHRWNYLGVVLAETFHLSYPCVFEWQGEYYMVPETFEANSVRLYRASSFPMKWECVATLLEGSDFVDTSPVYFGGRWWLFLSHTSSEDLHVYHAPDLFGPWLPHALSPVVSRNKHIARPGGRMLVFEGKLYRFAQDDHTVYGESVRAFEITELTPSTYAERAVFKEPMIKAAGGLGWNSIGMHHYDAVEFKGKWFAAIDGYGRDRRVRGINWRIPWRDRPRVSISLPETSKR